MSMRLSLKISIATAVSILGVFSVSGYLRLQRLTELLHGDVRRDHEVLGRAVSAMAEATAGRAGQTHALALVEDINVQKGNLVIRWVERPGTAREGSVRSFEHSENGVHELVTHVPAFLGAPGYIELRESLATHDQYIRGTVRRTVVAMVLQMALTTALIFALGYWLLGRPLQLVMAKARRIGAGGLTGPLTLHRRDEMGELAREMNAMCDRLLAAQRQAEQEAAGRFAALEQLRHAERLTTVGKLASGVAHELGTPLNVVSARAKMIARARSQGDQASRDAQIIYEQAERMTGIIRQLLDFARPKRPHRGLENLNRIVETTLELLVPNAQRHDVRLVRQPIETDPVSAFADAAQVQQMLINLVMNAIQAQPSGGEVRAGAYADCGRFLEPAQSIDPNAYVCLVVEDDGPGIAPEVRTRMFEPFFTTKEVGQGTGLGLSVLHGMVQEHGGSIAVQTELGKGTQMCVFLPRRETGG